MLIANIFSITMLKPLVARRLIVTVAAMLFAAGGAEAVTALGMTAEEMAELYGDSFVKQVRESEAAMENVEKMEAETNVEEPASPDGQEQPTPSDEKDSSPDDTPDDGGAPGEQADKPQDNVKPQDGKDAPSGQKDVDERRIKAELLANVEIMIKTKRRVDAKISRSRNEIKNMRRRMAYIDTTLRKRREKENKRYDRELKAHNYGPSSGTYSNGYSSYPEKREVTLSNLDRNTVTNSQKRIAQYKNAIPQLIAFSQELMISIDKSSKKLGPVKSAIVSGYEPDIPAETGSESESDVMDAKSLDSFGH